MLRDRRDSYQTLRPSEQFLQEICSVTPFRQNHGGGNGSAVFSAPAQPLAISKYQDVRSMESLDWLLIPPRVEACTLNQD